MYTYVTGSVKVVIIDFIRVRLLHKCQHRARLSNLICDKRVLLARLQFYVHVRKKIILRTCSRYVECLFNEYLHPSSRFDHRLSKNTSRAVCIAIPGMVILFSRKHSSY